MTEKPHPDAIAGHVDAIAKRTEHDTRELVAAIASRCWSRSSERTVPAALEWLRRWGPKGLAPVPPACSCRLGHCAVCN